MHHTDTHHTLLHLACSQKSRHRQFHAALCWLAEDYINSEPTLEILSSRWINNIYFRGKTDSQDDANAFNKKARLNHS